NADNAAIADDTGTATIVDDDDAVTPQISIDDITVNETDGNAVFTVTLDTASSQEITVNFATNDGSAISPDDYTSDTGSVTFAAGETIATITIPVINDTLDENNETFSVSLSNADNAAIADDTGTATIVDDDVTSAIVSISPATISQNEGDSGTTLYIYQVTLSADPSQPVIVNYSTNDGTATVADGDYNDNDGSLTFNPGETLSQTITVEVNGDTDFEPDETFTVSLDSITGNATVDPSADDSVATIVNDDDQPVISITPATISQNEGNTGTTTYTFEVTLSAPASQAVTVNYSTNDGTATVGNNDYVDNDGSITFAVGETIQTITVEVNGDTTFEPDETFSVSLDSVTGDATIDPNADESTATIVNDDGLPNLTIDDITVDEGEGVAVFTVFLDTPSSENVSVDFTTVPGTATEDDYTPTNGTLSFAPGETVATITVPIVDDLLDEFDETFSIQLDNPSNATITDDTATAAIADDDEQPNLSIDDLTVNEDDGNVLFTVSLDTPSGKDISVDFTTVNGSAGNGDFTPTSGTVVIPAGQTSVNIPVTILNDSLDEPDETFTIELSDPSNANIADDTATGTILDDDGQPNLTIDNISVNEDDGVAVFTVSSDAASGQEITVDFTTVTGTATEADFTENSGTVTIAPGETSTTITIEITDDNLDEADETFTVALTAPSNANIVDDTGTATILDDDGKPNLVIDDAIVNEDDGVVVFTINLDAPSGQEISLDFNTVEGTATNNDFTPTTGTLTIPAGQTTATITVPIVDDNLDEPDESFSIQLTNPNNVNLSDDTATATIDDNDGLPEISIDDVTVSEGDVEAVFTVSLTGETSQDVIVDFTTNDESAIASSDYTSTSGSVTITAGETSATITVPILDDLIDEPGETFTVDLSNPINAEIVDNQGVGTITDNDLPVEISIDDITVNEADGIANFTVSIDQAISQAVTVDFTTADGDAIAEIDYRTASGTIVIPAGQTTTTISVNLVEDQINEPDETFSVNLTNPSSNARFGDDTGIATIIDDDPTPTLSFENLNVIVNEEDGTITFTLVLDTPSQQDISVDFTTNNGTATGGQDFTPTSGTINIPAGQTTATITIPILEDLNDEPAEEFTVSLSNPVNVRIEDEPATGTIIDNDLPVEIAIDDVTVNEAEGVATFTVSIDQAISQAVTVDFNTGNGDAIANNDYTPTSGTLTISPGETSATVSVEILQDEINEPDETFNLNLSNPSNNARFGDNTGIATIIDDDPTPTLSFENPNVTVNETDGIITFTLVLDTPSEDDISVDFTTNDGTATGNQDFTPTSGTINIPAGETSVTITVPILDDDLEEPSEDFTISLSNPVNVRLDDATATGTILDDETDTTPPVVTINPLTTDDPTPELTGTVDDPDAEVIVTINGVDYPAINNGDGTWTLPDDTIDTPLDPDTYDVVVTATDPSGNVGEDDTTDELTVTPPDTTPPVVTINPLTTDDPTPELTGTVDDPDADVVVTVNGVDYPAINNGDGTWTLPDDTIDTPLDPETYDVEVTATDPSGNVGEDDTTDELTVTPPDTTPPVVTIDPLTTDDPTPELTGTVDDPDAEVIVTVNGVDYPAINNGDGTWTLPDDTIDTPLDPDTYDVVVTATDPSGNVGEDDTTDELTVTPLDTTPPVVTVDFLTTEDPTPQLTGTIDDPDAEVIVTINGVDYPAINNGDGTWTLPDDTIEIPLLNETYDVVVTATDPSGNVGVDETDDELTIIAPLEVTVDPLVTDDNTPPLTGTVNDPNADVVVTINGIDYPAINNGDGTWTIPDNVIEPLEDGTYDVVVTATDDDGNTDIDDTLDELIIDTTPPVVTIDPLITNDRTPELTGTIDDPNATVIVTINGVDYEAINNGDGTWTLPDDTIETPLDPGSYDIQVTAIDEAGNTTVNDPIENELVIDLTPPTVTVDFLTTLDSTPQLTGTIDDPNATVIVTINGVDYEAINNGDGTWTLPDDTIEIPLDADTFDVEVTAIDEAGNVGEDDTTDELTVVTIDDFEITPNENNVFEIDGPIDGVARIKYTLDEDTEVSLINELGVFRVNDLEGGIDVDGDGVTDLTPDDEGYLAAALQSGEVIFSALPGGLKDCEPPMTIRDFQTGDLLSYYLVQDGTSDTILAALAAGNEPTSNVFFGSVAANSDSLDHLEVTNLTASSYTLNWEDVVGGGDRDFDDFVVDVEITTENRPLGASLQGEEEQEVFDIRDVSSGELIRVSAEVLPSTESLLDNKVGLYRLVDESGVVRDRFTGNLIAPGEIGYRRAALSQTQFEFGELETGREFIQEGLYAPYIFTDDGDVYFPFLEANPNQADQLLLLGDNTFSFEDVLATSEEDYNDIVFKIDFDTDISDLGITLNNLGDDLGNDDDIFQIGGEIGRTANLKFTLEEIYDAGVVNEVGVFVFNDLNGGIDINGDEITDFLPGDVGYLEAVLASSQTIFAALTGEGLQDCKSPMTIREFQTNDLLGFYMVTDGTTDTVLAELALGHDVSSNIFFAPVGANQDDFDHLEVEDLGNSAYLLNWEDEIGGGDRDFNDFTLKVEVTNQATPLGAILQGDGQLETFDLRDLAAGEKALAEFTVFPSTESSLDNRAGLYQLADESGRVQDPVSGNLLAPGDAGYQEAAIAQSVVELGKNGTNPVELESGLYAPYFLIDGETAYFPFREANPDFVDQVALLGDNKVGFEDGANGGDLDYNDFVLGVDFTVV
ncbi:MAG: Calx-beta domain-containing protein, partial [Oscillatoria sp. PMC 1068.18]|nr:Calx-beta domain-containing protein [Oscillatoria sp. PMC 1068.18]